MHFSNTEYFIIIPFIPILIFAYIFRFRIQQKKLKQIFGKQITFLTSRISYLKRHIKFLFQILALVLFIIALLRPQVFGKLDKVENKGIQMVLVLDISQSMLSEDVKPNRLYLMKQKIEELVNLSPKDQIAIVAFAGTAILISPFTNDLSIIKLYLKNLFPDYISFQGTHFYEAFQKVQELFERIKSKGEKPITRVVVMASDGENHENRVDSIIKSMTKDGIRIFTLSFGTKEGGVIPLKNSQNQLLGYKKDNKGKVVVTKLRNKSLKHFSKEGKGAYYHASYEGDEILKLRQNIDQLKQSILETGSFRQTSEYFQYFLFFGLFFAFLELILGDRKRTAQKF